MTAPETPPPADAQPADPQPAAPRPSAPSPASLAARAAAATAEPADPQDHPITGEVRDLLAQAVAIREAAGDEFDLTALRGQADLLARAQERLSAVLEDVGRG